MTQTFKEFTKASVEEGSVLLVDALNMAFSFRGEFDYKDKYIRMVNSLAKSYKSEHIVIAADWGSSSYRLAIYEGYKSGRKEKFANQTEAEKLEFELFFKEYNAILEELASDPKYILLRYPKVEADDIAAYIVKNRKRFKIKKIWMISSDRDWDLLIQEDVSRFSYVNRKEFTYENWNEHYEWSQEQHISIKCLQGDDGDSVPGVDGVGPKRALGLVQTYGSAMDVASALPLPGKQKFIQAVNEFGEENILRNYQLMDLLSFCEEAIGPENTANIDEVLCNLK